ncbi:breast cancer anti-estrogen resistance protein 3-like isoform X2 [Mastacembelus armatus]|uniref:Breast cancer anti-estrogen resistance protein 3-like n=1 Tax=Mastacembelus armatus TaxID=205130 RepID=A0A3Q3S7G8_9TELE|nr:breast cancer anti-estrogen resistance protein 3-like isoform X2 [Mastacembelus armatus]
MKHQSISRWLNQLGLPQYCAALEQEYDGVEDLLHLTEHDLLELGVHNHLHRLHLLTSLCLLQERERRRELRMMTEGRFASLPRSLHAHHTLGGGTTLPGVPSTSVGVSSNSSCSSRRLQSSLTSSMDLLSSRTGLPGQDAGLSELPAAAYQPVSIHGTLPRRKRGGANLNHGKYTWDPRANHTQPLVCANTSQVPGHVHQPMISPVVQNIIDDFHGYREPATGLDATVDYVKFSRDQFILDCPSEKLRRELEEELKMNCEDPRSHAWYHGAIPRQVAENLVQRDGDFLIRDSLSSPGCYVLTCQWRNAAQHFKINKKVVMLNEAYSRVEYWLEREGFDNVPALIRYYVGNRKPVSQVVGAIIFQPINRGLPLRCLEEKYGIPSSHREAGSMAQERRSQKRLSLNITNGHAHDNTHSVHDNTHSQDNGMGRGSQLRLKDRCGSQPASLNQVPERRRPLKAHQSESFLPIGSKPQPQQTPDLLHPSPNPKSPVFRTGSEPALSPSVPRRSAEPLTDQTIRGSDSQLCPKPPPKPSKMLQARLPRSPCLQPLVPPSSSSSNTGSSSTSHRLTAPPPESTGVETPASPWSSGATTVPPVPPVKPLKFPQQLLPADPHSSSSSVVTPPELDQYLDSEAVAGQTEWLQLSPARQRPSSLLGKEETNLPDCITDNGLELQLPLCSYVERLGKEEDTGERRGLDRSSYHHAIAALENTSEEEEDDGGREEEDGQKDKWREKESSGFHRPVIETESTFRPAEFGSRLLPPENKPLEMVVLKRAKELLLKHNHHSIARHLLMADCQVARILGVTPELKGQMGVSSGLELVTLPHGCQLRLDLMERHHTMAIGVAVDILGCTGSVEERASTLNRIILVALELKDTVGDLFAFTALMKALDLPQISRLEETWTTLRRNYTQTAISYEKTLKPFYKSLYEGTASCPPVVCVPLLLPLLTLMERPSITPEGPELWETSDQGCDIMLRHLEAARDVARNTQTYTNNAQKILQGFQCDNDLLEVFKTDFHLRLLWGSRGASVNQSDRYSKFNLILTALSRKLEPTPKTQTLI